MWRGFIGLAAAALLAPGGAAHAQDYGYSGYGYGAANGADAYAYRGDSGRYGRYGYGYQPAGGYGYSGGGYEDEGYGGQGYDGGGYGYDYGASPYSAPAHYCREHLEYHLRQAWMNDQAPYHDWWGTGGPEAWHEAMEADHARFHYTHPGSWRCEYQGWPSG
jgi:hypothetical protein